MYNSPDERANAFFSEQFSEHQELFQYEPLNEKLHDTLSPRSVVAAHGRLLPGSFLGLPVLYGSIGMIFGVGVIPFLTPLIAVLAIFVWYKILGTFFKKRIALFSAIVLLLHPAWQYYTSRSMMHNVLFTSLLIFAVGFFVLKPISLKKKFAESSLCLNEIFSGLMLGAALFVRGSEFAWIAVSTCLLIFLYRKHVSWQKLMLFMVGVFVALLPMFFLNQSLYGGYLTTGYTIETETVVHVDSSVESEVVQTPEITRRLVSPISPFGIHPKTALKHTWQYGINLFLPLSILAFIGLLLMIKQRKYSYIGLFLLVSVWLTLMYGSWTFFDNPDPEAVTLANSYVRYWLPIFVLMTPFVAFGIDWLTDKVKPNRLRQGMILGLFAVLFLFTAKLTFLTEGDGLYFVRENLIESTEIRERILSQTESNAVIIVDRADKIIFPNRTVRYPLRDETTYALMPQIIEEASLYYYGIQFPEKDMNFLNNKRLAALGLRIDEIDQIGIEALYRISKVEL